MPLLVPKISAWLSLLLDGHLKLVPIRKGSESERTSPETTSCFGNSKLHLDWAKGKNQGLVEFVKRLYERNPTHFSREHRKSIQIKVNLALINKMHVLEKTWREQGSNSTEAHEKDIPILHWFLRWATYPCGTHLIPDTLLDSSIEYCFTVAKTLFHVSLLLKSLERYEISAWLFRVRYVHDLFYWWCFACYLYLKITILVHFILILCRILQSQVSKICPIEHLWPAL